MGVRVKVCSLRLDIFRGNEVTMQAIRLKVLDIFEYV